MDVETITLLIGIIGCAIGVAGFINGRMARAERNGVMETKINQALDGITAINAKLEASAENQEDIKLLLSAHDEKIRTLFNKTQDLRNDFDKAEDTRTVMSELVQAIRNLKGGTNEHRTD